jgi:hypothetical protein
MGFIVVSSFENTATGDLQAQGESIAVFADETRTRTHFAHRSAALEAAARRARAADADATFIVWILALELPLDIDDVDQALEDLETVIEDAADEEEEDDVLAALAIAYSGTVHAPAGESAYAQRDALDGLRAWLS